MLEWIQRLPWYQQLFWIISIVFTLLFFIQFIASILNKHPRKSRNKIVSYLFSFPNISAFLSMFGWVTIACIYQGISLFWAILIGILCGLVMMAIMPVIFYYFRKMRESYSPNEVSKVSTIGEVIREVGRKRSNPGLVKMNMSGDYKEMVALTDFDHDVKIGTKIEVESVLEDGVLIIKPLQ